MNQTLSALVNQIPKGEAILVASPAGELDPDPRRLITGAPLTASEIRSGYYVERTIADAENQPLACADLAAHLHSTPGRQFYISAGPGAGKSTLAAMLVERSDEHLHVAVWRPRATANGLHEFVSNHARRFPGLDLLVVRDSGDRHEEHDTADRLELAEELLAVHHKLKILHLVRPRDRRLHAALPALAIDEPDPAAFVSALEMGLSAIGGTGLVNPATAPSTTEERLKLFSQPGPLIAKMLRATFGPKFVQRLVDESKALSAPDRLAYLIICIASETERRAISDDRILTVSPGATPAERGGNDPWLRSGDRNYPRHRLIARTVLAQSPEDSVQSAVDALLRCSKQSHWAGQLVLGFTAVADSWLEGDVIEPMSQEELARAALLRAIRRAVTDGASDIEELIAQSNDPEELGRWARTLAALLPRQSANSANRTLLKLVVSVNRAIEEVGSAAQARNASAHRQLAELKLENAAPLAVDAAIVNLWAPLLEEEADSVRMPSGQVERLAWACVSLLKEIDAPYSKNPPTSHPEALRIGSFLSRCHTILALRSPEGKSDNGDLNRAFVYQAIDRLTGLLTGGDYLKLWESNFHFARKHPASTQALARTAILYSRALKYAEDVGRARFVLKLTLSEGLPNGRLVYEYFSLIDRRTDSDPALPHCESAVRRVLQADSAAATPADFAYAHYVGDQLGLHDVAPDGQRVDQLLDSLRQSQHEGWELAAELLEQVRAS